MTQIKSLKARFNSEGFCGHFSLNLQFVMGDIHGRRLYLLKKTFCKIFDLRERKAKTWRKRNLTLAMWRVGKGIIRKGVAQAPYKKDITHNLFRCTLHP